MDFQSIEYKNMLDLCYCIGISIKMIEKKEAKKESWVWDGMLQTLAQRPQEKTLCGIFSSNLFEDKFTFNIKWDQRTSTPWCNCTLHIGLFSSRQDQITCSLGSKGKGEVRTGIREGNHRTLFFSLTCSYVYCRL